MVVPQFFDKNSILRKCREPKVLLNLTFEFAGISPNDKCCILAIYRLPGGN